MKLSMKITLIFAGMMLILFSACITMLSLESRSRILAVTLDNGFTKQNNLLTSLYDMVNYYTEDESEPASVVEHAVVRYCFSRFADETSILMLDGDLIYGGDDTNAQELLPITQSYEQQYFIGKVNGMNMLIVGSKVKILKNEYTVYTVQDITSIYQVIHGMIIKFVLIGLVFIIFGISVLAIVVRYAMNPLKKLTDTACCIAMGGYDVRVQMKSDDEIGNLARNFNLMAEAIEYHIAQLKETTERQRLFIGGLTHEFKTPLTALIGHSETLLNTKQPSNVVSDSLNFIHERCEWLERLTQKLLKLVTLRERAELIPASVPRLLAATREDVQEIFRLRGVELRISCATDSLPMDSDLMRSALINLCDNAAKASEPEQVVTIKVQDDMIEVIDHGCGMADDQIAYITEPFYMIDRSRNKKNGGSGLGLALVKQIVEAHNAKLQFESRLGEGTTARIIFPQTYC